MSLRIRIVVTCSQCERETEATGIAFVDISDWDVKFREVEFPRAAITGSESEWRFDERAQVATCPECAPKEPA